MNFCVASARSRERWRGVCGMLGSVGAALLLVGGGGSPASVRWCAVTASGIWFGGGVLAGGVDGELAVGRGGGGGELGMREEGDVWKQRGVAYNRSVFVHLA